MGGGSANKWPSANHGAIWGHMGYNVLQNGHPLAQNLGETTTDTEKVDGSTSAATLCFSLGKALGVLSTPPMWCGVFPLQLYLLFQRHLVWIGSALYCDTAGMSYLVTHLWWPSWTLCELNPAPRYSHLLATLISIGPYRSGRHLQPRHCHPHSFLTCRRWKHKTRSCLFNRPQSICASQGTVPDSASEKICHLGLHNLSI